MTMHLIIATMFAIAVILSLIEDHLEERQKMYFLVVFAFIMILLPSTKSIEHTADALNYENMFLNNDDPLIELATEPTFIYLSRIINDLGGTIRAIFIIYALIAIPVKLAILYRLTPYIFTALIIYLPVYFELHDMIQIRVSAAAMFIMASIFMLSKKKNIIAGLLMIGGILFHYSAVAFLPFLFIGNRKLNSLGRITMAILLPVCFSMYFLKLDLFSFIPSFLTEGKVDFYKESAEIGKWDDILVPYTNPFFLAKCILLYACLFFYDTIVEKNEYSPIIINIFAASLFFFLSMATIPVIAGRISDFYGIFDSIIFTFTIYILAPPILARIFIIAIGLYMLINNMLFYEYFT